MAELDANILNGIRTVRDYEQLQQAFEAKKQMEALQAQVLLKKAATGADLPNAVQEYNFYNNLDDNAKREFLNVKRANNPLNLGNTFAIRDQLTNQVSPLQGGEIAVAPKVVDLGGEFGVAGAGGVQPLSGGGKGLTPQQQAAENIKTREAQDLFNRGVDVQKRALETTERLLDNEAGVRANRGSVSTRLPNIKGSSVNAAADLETLTSLLTTENLGLLKGVLSDSDLRLLANISAGELQGDDKKTLDALARLQKALSNKVTSAQPYRGGSGLPPLLSAIDNADPILTPQPNTGRRVVKWDDL